MNNTTLQPQPLEELILTAALSGEKGSNRAAGFITQQIAAQNDLQAIQAWLAEFKDSPQTYRAYRLVNLEVIQTGALLKHHCHPPA